MTHESIGNTAAAVTYVGAGISVGSAAPHYVFGLTMDQWSVLGIIFGMAMAFAGLVVNIWFKRKHYLLESAVLSGGEHEAS